MEYVLIELNQNFNDRIILENSLYWNLPIPVVAHTRPWGEPELLGKIIEIRKEGPYLVGVADTFNEDPDFFGLAIGVDKIKATTRQDGCWVIERGEIREAIVERLAFTVRE